MLQSFKALIVNNQESFTVSVKQITLDDLPADEVLIKVHYSSVNYKDGLAGIPDGNIVKSFPFIPGIDLAGYIVSSTDSRLREGQPVVATGYGIGVSHYGGFSEYVRLPSEWVVPLPRQLSLREAMIYGTAGFTAALSIHKLEENGMSPDKGKVLVTGASGGVGGISIALLSHRGYEVAASTGRISETGYLKALGASEIIHRDEIYAGGSIKPMDKQRWQAAVDPVGGSSLAAVLSRIAYGGSVAVSGLTGGTAFPASVLPFILRGVNLLGIDSVFCPAEIRGRLWERMGDEWKPPHLEQLVDREISLDELPRALEDILHSRTRGRVLVRLSE